MFKKIISFITLASCLAAFTSFKSVRDHHPFQKDLRTIVIDAGHGLPDPGAEGKYSTESQITLAIAMKLGKQLQTLLPDCKIVYTRTGEDLPEGLQNKNVANRLR